jgi:hypothetical protein
VRSPSPPDSDAVSYAVIWTPEYRRSRMKWLAIRPFSRCSGYGVVVPSRHFDDDPDIVMALGGRQLRI